MKQLKCENCGATIKIDDNDKDYGTCPYCKAKYQLNERKDINIKLDDNTKELLTSGFSFFKKTSKIAIIPIIIFSLIVIAFIITIGVSIFKQVNRNKNNNLNNNTIETKEDTTNNTFDEIKKKVNKSFFNSKFESQSGTKSKFLTESILDDIVTNNKTNKDMLITLIYKDQETTNPDTIIEIKHSLSDKKKYEIKIDYDEDGYVNRITIEDI